MRFIRSIMIFPFQFWLSFRAEKSAPPKSGSESTGRAREHSRQVAAYGFGTTRKKLISGWHIRCTSNEQATKLPLHCQNWAVSQAHICNWFLAWAMAQKNGASPSSFSLVSVCINHRCLQPLPLLPLFFRALQTHLRVRIVPIGYCPND